VGFAVKLKLEEGKALGLFRVNSYIRGTIWNAIRIKLLVWVLLAMYGQLSGYEDES
jgi:hypothetical protein